MQLPCAQKLQAGGCEYPAPLSSSPLPGIFCSRLIGVRWARPIYAHGHGRVAAVRCCFHLRLPPPGLPWEGRRQPRLPCFECALLLGNGQFLANPLKFALEIEIFGFSLVGFGGTWYRRVTTYGHPNGGGQFATVHDAAPIGSTGRESAGQLVIHRARWRAPRKVKQKTGQARDLCERETLLVC